MPQAGGDQRARRGKSRPDRDGADYESVASSRDSCQSLGFGGHLQLDDDAAR
jgi:hypothetical protein